MKTRSVMVLAIDVRSIEFRRISYQKFITNDNRSNEREARCTSRLRTADRARITLCHCWQYREWEECQILLSSGIKFFFFLFSSVLFAPRTIRALIYLRFIFARDESRPVFISKVACSRSFSLSNASSAHRKLHSLQPLVLYVVSLR